MRLGDPNPETRYDFLKFVAKRRSISVAEAYRRKKRKGITREESFVYNLRRYDTWPICGLSRASASSWGPDA